MTTHITEADYKPISEASMSDTTIPILRFRNGSQMSTLYYYNGNFYHPLDFVSRDMEQRVRRLIDLFIKNNREMVRADRAHPDYRNKVQLAFDEVFPGAAGKGA